VGPKIEPALRKAVNTGEGWKNFSPPSMASTPLRLVLARYSRVDPVVTADLRV